MSRHISRKQRWQQLSAKEYAAVEGRVVYRERAWFGIVKYKTRSDASADHMPEWETHEQRLGPFKRPRDAMVAVEREVTFLRNRHGDRFLLEGEA